MSAKVVYRLATEEDFPIVKTYYAKLDGIFRRYGFIPLAGEGFCLRGGKA